MHNSQVAEAMVRLGHRVTVVTALRDSVDNLDEVRNGVRVVRVAHPNWNRYRQHVPILGQYLRFVDAMRYSHRVGQRLVALDAVTPIDVIEFADVNAEGFFWSTRGDSRTIVRCHTPLFVLQQDVHHRAPYDMVSLGWAEKKMIHRIDRFTAPSLDMAATISEVCQVPRERFVVIPNAIDLNRFQPLEQTESAKDHMEILYVGRLERAKGIEVLLQAISVVCKRVSDLRFVLIGPDRPSPEAGSYRDLAEKRLAPFIAAGQVDIRGKVSEEDLIRAYQVADVAVVPSLSYESFSYTVAQAMACRLPVVASRIGGIPETLGYGQCGLLIPRGSVEELVDALLALRNDPAWRQQLGQAGYNRAVSEFDAGSVAQRTLEFYRANSATVCSRLARRETL